MSLQNLPGGHPSLEHLSRYLYCPFYRPPWHLYPRASPPYCPPHLSTFFLTPLSSLFSMSLSSNNGPHKTKSQQEHWEQGRTRPHPPRSAPAVLPTFRFSPKQATLDVSYISFPSPVFYPPCFNLPLLLIPITI